MRPVLNTVPDWTAPELVLFFSEESDGGKAANALLPEGRLRLYGGRRLAKDGFRL
jgi:hypothetical protein